MCQDLEYEYKINKEYEGERIDKFLSKMLPDISRSYIQKLIKDKNISVNNVAVKSNYKLNLNDKIFVMLPPPQKIDIVPENIPLDIVYEDGDIVVINKPKDMVVHPAPGHYSNTLVNALLYYLGDNLSGINGVIRPGIVHRIDKDTTGLLVICKNDKSHNFIAEQLSKHSITRTYHAIALGKMKENTGTINKPIYRDSVDRKKMAINQNGREAITHYEVIDYLYNQNKKEYFTYVKCNLETGRTHQIRLHMSSIKHPLLGDIIYGPSKQPIKTQGQVLHAKTLGFIHPSTGKYIEFDSELPDYFSEILTKYKKNN